MLPALVASTTSSTPTIQITEIMYNPPGDNTGREWIEVRNTGSDSIALSSKSLRIIDAHGKHGIKPASGDGEVAAGALAIIATNPSAFLADYPSYTGALFKSALSLTRAGSIAAGDTGGHLFAQADYSSDAGGKNDGNSLQIKNGKLVAGRPTPGVYAAIPPAPLAAPAKSTTKPTTTKRGSTKQGATVHPEPLTDTAYDPGIIAPTAAATAPAVGALFAYLAAARPLISSVWFSIFLALLAISAFSLILITRRDA